MRTQKTAINIVVNVIGQLLNFMLSLLNRSVMARLMPSDYLGVNGLFVNVLTIMSLAELGIGSAMLYVLYKPVAEQDQRKIQELMNLYRRLYRWVAMVVAVIGVLMYPLLPVLVKSNTVIENLHLIYFMYVAQSISSYFFVYKSALLSANQEHYIINIYNDAFLLGRYVLQIIALLLTRNFLLYLTIQIVMGVIPNILISKAAEKKFPFIQENKDILPPKEEQDSIFKNVKAMFMHKIGTVMVYNVDNLLMSALIGLSTVGVFSNYKLISTNLTNILGQIINGSRNSIGNLVATEKDEGKIYGIFNALNFACFLLFSYGTVAMAILFTPFLKLFFGDNYLFPTNTVVLILAQFYLSGMRNIVQQFRDAMGIFWYDRYKAMVEVVVNLVLSLLLARFYGLNGILGATVIDLILIPFWVEPLILFRYGIKEHTKRYMFEYYAHFTLWTISMLAGGFAAMKTCQFVTIGGFVGLIAKGLTCTAVYAAVMLVLYVWTAPFKLLLQYALRLVSRKKG